MKTRMYLFAMCLLMASVITFAQPEGTERAGGWFQRYAKLTTVNTGNPFTNALNNHRALGVYTSTNAPSSWLEVNSTNAYSLWKHPNVADRGEVFRTVSPYNFAAYWRLIQGTTEIGLLYSLANDDDFNILASEMHRLTAMAYNQ